MTPELTYGQNDRAERKHEPCNRLVVTLATSPRQCCRWSARNRSKP